MKNNSISPSSSVKNKKITFDDDGNTVKSTGLQRKSRKHDAIGKNHKNRGKPDDNQSDRKPAKNKKIVFGDDGEAVESSNEPKANVKTGSKRKINSGDSYKARSRLQDDENEAWYSVYATFNTNSDLVELKESELKALTETCESNFKTELPNIIKKNPSDAKWLQTALHKGTARDRVNSGALLVHSNPLANLNSLETLVGFCKVSNRSGAELLSVLADLFIEALLPADRKLLQLSLRGADWKALRARDDISKEMKNRIYASWHFENELKELYFAFLKNLQTCLQTGQEPVKNAAIYCAAKLLCHSPEKEQMILSMLVNKLGDPSNKVAAKALHHLSEVTFNHPNMCGVITMETEKLLFRNNISEQAQHFALCFLAQIAPRGHSDVCTKLVNICFAFFKVLVKNGAVNSKTMQAILRCLQKAIVDAKPAAGSTEIINREMQDTIYRLIHLADIRIAVQTLSLLLQLIVNKSEKSDRFYNALYKKMTDMSLTTIGTKVATQFFHIIHRAIHIDSNVPRAMAFIKRLLQIALYMSASMACGCLIVINKILRSRPELRNIEQVSAIDANFPLVSDVDLSKFDDDDEDEKYEDVLLPEDEAERQKIGEKSKVIASWHHVKVRNNSLSESHEEEKVKEIRTSGYDPYSRVPAFAGAQFACRTELVLLERHFHPTCKIFAETVAAEKAIGYYGDPLRDFSLAQFLERFAFKNPKKLGGDKDKENEPTMSAVKSMYNKLYVPHGGRGQSVMSLTKDNCPENELFIFNYLEKKRERQVADKTEKEKEEIESIDDDEFESYLDGLCKKTDERSDEEVEDEFDVDFLKEMGGDLKADEKKGKKKKRAKKMEETEEDSDAEIDDWGDDDNEMDAMDDDDGEGSEEEQKSDDEGSISLDEDGSVPSGDDDMSDGSINGDESDDEYEYGSGDESDAEDGYEPKRKKSKLPKSNKDFNKALKSTNDMSSLFAAADDFAELLEETGKEKRHGTSSAVFNKDKSSVKQLKWEEKRRHTITGKKFKNKSKKFVKRSRK